MTLDEIRAVDKSGMYELIRDFPAQVNDAATIGESAILRLATHGIRQIVLSGMGGSAIGGDLVRSYVSGELRIPFLVNRHYTLPDFVGRETLLIASSYSGETEEAISALKDAVKRKSKVVCICSGGTLAKVARARNFPVIHIPGGLPPRAALGYAFFPLLIALTKLGFIRDRKREIRETVRLLENKSGEYSNPDSASNSALQLASQLRGRIGIVYSASEHLDAVNTRWRGQMAENAKTLMFGSLLPEMNHNELVGWKVLGPAMREIQVVFLRDTHDHPRVQRRMDLTKGILAAHTSRLTEVWSEGSSLLARMFSLIYFGDWVSFYLSILHAEDPTPIPVIEYLKSELSKA